VGPQSFRAAASHFVARGAVEYLANFSNILMLVAYLVRDVLWLRCFAVASAIFVVPYYLVQPTILWVPVFWAGVFTVINLGQIARLLLDRRPVKLAADEQQLYDLGFHVLRPREFVALLLSGEWCNADVGETVLRQGDTVSAVCVAIAGKALVEREGRKVGELAPGQLIGDALALSGNASSVSATFIEPARYMRWSVVNLRKFAERRPELRTTLQSMVNHDLVRKLETILA
jgi:Popeye protein conserved region